MSQAGARQFRDGLDTKVAAGGVRPADAVTRQAEIDAHLAARDRHPVLAPELAAREAVLAVGPHASAWHNGAWVVSLDPAELAVLVLRIGQTLGFYTLLGAWAFDDRPARQAWGRDVEWRRFARLGDRRGLAALASLLVGSIGVAVSSVLTGQFTTGVSLLVSLVVLQGGPPARP